MQKEAIALGATIEEAKANAAAELGLAADEVEFEVLQEPQKKTLGLFGGAPAKVRVFVNQTPAQLAADYLRDILAGMQAGDVTVEVTEEENSCTLSLVGEHLGFVIGRRGDTLDALQYLVGLVANRACEDYYRVTIDIENYREKREKSLVGLANKMGNQVRRTGRKASLEPMNPYERRIIHTTIQNIDGVTSWSIGSEPNRHVVIGLTEEALRARKARSNKPREERAADGENRPQREQRNRRNNGGRRDVAPERPARQIREFVPRSNPLPIADGATPPARTESEKESSATLYGRIDL